MWNGKMKALTFSYDDGVEQDKRLVELFNRYGMKATFNLNGSRHLSNRPGYPWVFNGNINVARMPIEDLAKTYVGGHEIAMHAYTHADLDALSDEVCKYEILADKARLTDFFGKVPVGLAYPCGRYSDRVVNVLRENGVKYARTVVASHSFDLQDDLLRFNPTCCDSDERLFELMDEFLNAKPTKPMLFYVWGHSYALDQEGRWERMERLCKTLAGRDDIFYGTNAECLL